MKRRNTYLLGILLALLMFLPSSMSAQLLRLQIFCLGNNGQEEKAVGVRVYGFLDNAHANKAQAYLRMSMTQEVLKEKTYRYTSTDLTDNDGIIDLMGVGNSGFILIDAGDYVEDPLTENFALVVDASKLNARSDDGGAIYTAKYVIRSKKTDVKRMKELETSAKRMDPEFSGEGIAVDNGTDVRFSFKIKVDSAYARDNARFVASPFLVSPTENNDTIGFFVPRALDGHGYRRTMTRRMGGDLENDKLNSYVIKDGFMRERTDTVVSFLCTLYNFDRTRKYNGLAHVWYEDHNSVYHHDVIRVWDGLLKNYNRFLDWRTAVPEVALDVEHYLKVGRPEATNKTKGYHLEFLLGKADLNMEDSTTVHDLRSLRNDIHNIFHSTTDDQILGDTIRGCSSPEGGYSTNLELARRRAMTVAQIVNSESAGGSKKLDSNKRVIVPFVVPWSEVADTLEVMGDSLSRSIAADLRGLVQQHNDNIDRINAAVGRYDWYRSYVLPQILPRMRRVEYKYKSATFAVLTQDQIYDRYKQQDGNFYSGAELRDYVYYNLMNTLYDEGDYKGLERIARHARENVKEDVNRIDTICMYRDSLDGKLKYQLAPRTANYQRPYALASFYLAQCLLSKGEYDSGILAKNYMDFDRPKEAHLHRDERQREFGWWNEPAIVVSQILMLCGEKNYNGASEVMKHHLNTEDPKFSRLGFFIRALQSEYDDEEVRDTVAMSSPMNFLVAWTAFADMTSNEAERQLGYNMILDLCNGDMTKVEAMYPDILDSWGEDSIDVNDFRVKYMKGIASFKLKCSPSLQMKNAPLLDSQFIYNPYGEEEDCWALPMLQALQSSQANADFFETDGTFNDSFRLLILFFYNRLNQGATMDQIKAEYDALRNNYNNADQK